MRTLVDLIDLQVQALDRIAKRQDRSRASLIREAVDDYLDRHALERGDDDFGSWGRSAVDGVAYQERVRSEW